MIALLAKLQRIDRRWLYLAMFALLMIPFAFTLPIPPGKAGPTTMGLYRLIESCPPDKVFIVDGSWDQGSAAENEAEMMCVIRHLCLRRKKFIVTSLGVTAFGPEFAQRVVEPIAAEYGYRYGEDYVRAGYVPTAAGGIGVLVDKLCRDPYGMYPKDANGTPMSALPLMERVRSARDVHGICVITYAPDESWISFGNAQHGIPVAFCCMSIMAPTYYRYWDSRQLAGILIGNGGAGEYERLLGHLGRGSKLALAGSFGNCAIILAAVIGNIGWWADRRQRRMRP